MIKSLLSAAALPHEAQGGGEDGTVSLTSLDGPSREGFAVTYSLNVVYLYASDVIALFYSHQAHRYDN